MENTKSKAKGQVQVDGIELQPITANSKKITSPILDGAKIADLNSYVSTHIKKKECVAFIPQKPSDGETCGCGYTRESHFHDTPDPNRPPEINWDPQKHVKEFPTDAHGYMIFTGTTRTLAKYVRASSNTQPSILFKLMTEQWGLRVPSLLISVTGGAKDFNISPRLKTQFSRAIVKAARSTGAWIITGGSHAGVMKHVGEAIRNFSGVKGSEIVLIGIATWGIVHNRKLLISKAGGAPALYPMDERSQGALCCLDNNHTHFILVDDGTHGRYGVEIPLRTCLEKYISEQTMHKGVPSSVHPDNRRGQNPEDDPPDYIAGTLQEGHHGSAGQETTIKTVCVVLEGGPGTLDTIYSSICNNTPCVIVEGSGRVADIIAQVANLSSSRITVSLIKEKLKNLFSESYDNFAEDQIYMWTKKIQDIVRKESLLTILREEKVGDQGMDVAILQALKASHKADPNSQENWDHQLKLAVSWNWPEIAETQIFTEGWTWKPSDLYPSLTQSLIDDKPSFVRLFLELGVSLAEYLTRDTLTYLYNKTKPSSLIHSKLVRQATSKRSKKVSKIELHHVSHVLQDLLGHLTEPLYPEAKDKQGMEQVKIEMTAKVGTMKPKNEQQLDHPVRDLLIWCIVQNRAEMADIFWNLTEDNVAGALACTKILKALYKEEEDTKKIEDMTALADIYEERAAGVFSECYRNNEERAELLLIHVNPKWGRATALELAWRSQALSFMSQGGVQTFLTKTWWGKLSVDNGFIQLLLCMLFFPLIYSNLIIYRKDFTNSPSSPDVSPNEKRKPSIGQVSRSDSKGKDLTNSPSSHDGNPNEERKQSTGQVSRSDSKGCLWKLQAFFSAPIVKFYYNVVSYVGFLWLFAYVLIVDFQTHPSWREYLLYIWVFSIFTEELRQLFYDLEHHGYVKSAVKYITEFWNKLDSMALALFTVGLICRLVRTDTVYLGRVFLSLDYMIFCIRLMYMFTVSRVLGPKIIILRRMVKDIFFFLFLLAIWIVSYGVAKQAILTTNEERLGWILRNVIYDPYITLFGEIPSDIDSLNFKPTQCSQNGTNPSMPKCVVNDGTNALFPEWLTIILMCLYFLMANILLLNLLVAIFSYTFAGVEKNTDQVWKFYRFGLIKEYNESPAAPPPFILLTHLYILLKHGICRYQARGHKVLKLELEEQKEISLLSWEIIMKDDYEQMKKQQEAESVSAMLCLLEKRLTVLEEQSTQKLNSALTEKDSRSKTRTLEDRRLQYSEETVAASPDGSGEKHCQYHVNSRILQYPDSKITRYPVPDEFVPWQVEFPGYDPPLYPAERLDRGEYDPITEMEQKSCKYNFIDGLYDFQSCCVPYTVKDGLPLNPMGRTGLRGIGNMCRFGPNHSLHPVLTRCSTGSASGPNQKASKNILEVLVVRWRGNELWSLPGGMLDPGQQIPIRFKALLEHTDLSEFLALLGSGTEVFHGYLDDPRNTDNAWIETLAVNIHLDKKKNLDKLLQNLKESDDDITLRWQLLEQKIPLYAIEKEILQRTAKHLHAHY